MSAWVLVPCLIALRAEFNEVNPTRDKGADGSIGDSAHTSSSDHTPDEDSDVLRDHDADDKNEVHALDIDSSGPWVAGSARESAQWFNQAILDLVERERAEYNSPTIKARLKYVIWNKRIASRSWGWTWRAYDGADPHTNHVHFSALYTTETENDTRSWGVADMPLTADDKAWILANVGPGATWTHKLQDPYDPDNAARNLPAGTWLRYAPSRGQVGSVESALARAQAKLDAIESVLVTLAGRPEVGAVTHEALVTAIREVLRDGVA